MSSPGDARRRVLFLVPTLRRAGAETQVIDLVNALDPTRFEKHLAFFEQRADQLSRINVTEVRVHRLVRRHKLDLSLVRRLAKLIEDHDIEIVHCTLQISLFFAYLTRLFTSARPRLIAAIHTTVNRSMREELYDRLLFRRLLRRCDRVQFVCHAQAGHWVAKYPELRPLATVVYNGVEPTRYDRAEARAAADALRERLRILPGRSVIACIAGLRQEKGHAFLIEAFAGLRADPWLLLAGDGPERERVEQLAARLGVRNRVVLLGEIADVRPVIAASDVTVLASTAVETFSMAMLESMAMAVPVIATDLGGLSEAITPGETGDLVQPRDVIGLRQSLQRMLDDEGARRTMGEHAHGLVSTRFSERAMADATAAMLNDLVPEGDAKNPRYTLHA